MDELLIERYALAKERVCEIKGEKAVQMPYLDFFQKTAAFLEKNNFRYIINCSILNLKNQVIKYDRRI
mgnify:CR=1 FL=1